MHFSLVLALSAASLVQANVHGAALLRRHMEAFSARATPSVSTSDVSNPDAAGLDSSSSVDSPPVPTQCITEAISIASSIPTPPPALLSEIEESQPTDICDFTVPASLSGEFSSYAQTMGVWAQSHMSELLGFAKTCGDEGANYSAMLAKCTATAAPKPSASNSNSAAGPSRIQSVSATATATATPSGGVRGSNSTQPVSSNAGSQTGVSAALLAVAGIAVLVL